MTDLESVRKQWLEEKAQYEQFGEALAGKLREELRHSGIWAEVSFRAKEIDSLIRKLIKKPKHDYNSIGDKCGIRAIVRYKSEIQPILDIAGKIFDCADLEHKEDALKTDKVGYLSVHADVKLRTDDALIAIYPKEKFRAEFQVRTMAQHLWSEMSHDAFYKNDEILNPLPASIKRRVYLLAGLVEVADNEFDRLNAEMPEIPEFELLKSLERHYFKLTTRRGDPELSLDVIRLLMPLYGKDTKQIELHINNFYNECEDVMHEVYDQAEGSSNRSAYLYQPEAIMIYDRLRSDSLGIREVWNEKYPENELERFANAFGISFD